MRGIMSGDIVNLILINFILENVVQGRVTQDEEGLDEWMVGQPGVSELIYQALASGVPVKDIIDSGLTAGMEIMMRKCEAGEYYFPDMLASAEAVGAAMKILAPYSSTNSLNPKGKILMVTVDGDLNDLGKKIVSMLLRGMGYEVKDLGTDIDSQSIVEAVRREEPQFLGLSASLTSTMEHIEDTIQKLTTSGLRKNVKVIVGGAPVSEDFALNIGADGYGADAFQAVAVVETLNSTLVR
jgi:5-methyltetrahydrofolate--homocysteine methyltransferase